MHKTGGFLHIQQILRCDTKRARRDKECAPQHPYEKMESVKYLLDVLRFYVCGKNRRHYGALKTSVISGGRTNISRISRESRLCQSKSESLAAEAHFTRKPTIRQE